MKKYKAELIHDLDNDTMILLIDQFKDFLDVTKVSYYTLENLNDNEIVIKFYDKNKRKIKLNE